MNSVSSRRVQEQYPDYEPEIVFTAALTLYHLDIKARVLVESPLSVFGSYVLSAIDLGADTAAALATLLGVEERDIAKGPGVELLESGLIAHDSVTVTGERKLVLTERGKQQLKSGNPLQTPRQRTLKIHYDPLSGQVLPVATDVTPRKVISQQGVYVLPYQNREPRLTDLRPADVREATSLATKRGERFEIVSFRSIEKIYAEYLPGIEVFMLRHRQSGSTRVVVTRHGQLLADQSRALQHLYENGVSITPADAVELHPTEPEHPLIADVLPTEVATPVAELSELEHRIEEIRERRSATQTKRERDELEQRLREEITRRDQVQQQLCNAVELIFDEQHRVLLERAFRESKEEVIVISPWMNRRAVDDHLCALIGNALQRGVRVRIGYGFIHETRADDADRHKYNAQQVIRRFDEYRRRLKPGQLEFVRVRQATHEKILLCDGTFGVTTSFNWLSYHGDRDAQFRRETGTVIYIPDAIEALTVRAREALADGIRS